MAIRPHQESTIIGHLQRWSHLKHSLSLLMQPYLHSLTSISVEPCKQSSNDGSSPL